MNKKIKNIFWQTCIKYLQSTIPMKNFIEYICPLQAYSDDDKIILLCPNNYIKEKIEKNYLSIIKNTVQNISDEKYEIKLITGSLSQYKKFTQDIKNEKKEELKNINTFIKSAIFMIIKTPGILYNPIVLYEEKNKNKNEIINFIIEKMESLEKDKKIDYTIIKNKLSEINDTIIKNKLIIIEDIETIKIDNKYKEKLNYIIELILENKKQLIITTSKHTKDLKNINEKTKKIISNGLTIKMDKSEKNIKIRKNTSITKIIENVLLYYNTSIEKIKNKKREKNIVLIRQIIFYLCKTLSNKTFAEISSYIGEYTNSNIIYSYNKIKKLIDINNTIKKDIQNIKNMIIE